MSKLIKRRRDAFEFILFLILAGILSGVGLTVTGLFAPFGIGILALTGAGLLIFGIFMLPLLVVVPYIIYRDNQEDKQLEKKKEQGEQKNQEEQLHQQEIARKAQEEYRVELEASPAAQARAKIISLLKKAPKKFRVSGEDILLNRNSSLQKVIAFRREHEDQYFLHQNGVKVFVGKDGNFYPSPIHKIIAEETVDFFIQFMKEVFQIELNRNHKHLMTEESSAGTQFTDYGYYFCTIEHKNIEKITQFNQEQAEKNALEFYQRWEVKRKFESIVDEWVNSIDDKEEKKIALTIKKRIFLTLTIKKIGKETFSLDSDPEKSASMFVIKESKKSKKIRRELFENLEAYLKKNQKDTVLGVELEESYHKKKDEYLTNVKIKFKNPRRFAEEAAHDESGDSDEETEQQSDKESEQSSESEESSDSDRQSAYSGDLFSKAFLKVSNILDKAPKGFPVRKSGKFMAKKTGVSSYVPECNSLYQNEDEKKVALQTVNTFVEFMSAVFKVNLQYTDETSSNQMFALFDQSTTQAPINGEIVCRLDDLEVLKKILKFNREEAKTNAEAFYQKWESKNNIVEIQQDRGKNFSGKFKEEKNDYESTEESIRAKGEQSNEENDHESAETSSGRDEEEQPSEESPSPELVIKNPKNGVLEPKFRPSPEYSYSLPLMEGENPFSYQPPVSQPQGRFFYANKSDKIRKKKDTPISGNSPPGFNFNLGKET